MKKHRDENEERLSIEATIEKYGFQVLWVAGEGGTSFCYTIGVWESYKLPEIIIVGLKTDIAHHVLNNVVNELSCGRIFETNVDYEGFVQDFPMMFKPVHQSNIHDYFGTAIRYYGTDAFPAWQLF